MKKIVFFIPAIILQSFMHTGSKVSPLVFAWIVLFIISGVLMSKGRFWGGVLGVDPIFI